MRAALDAWRRENDAQTNTPNPDCDEKEFRRLYIDTDPSTFDPLTAGEEDWADIRTWREGMDNAVRRNKK